MTEHLFHALVISLVLTVLFELLFALIWGVAGKQLRAVVLMNFVTNPPAVTLHFLLTGFVGIEYWFSAIPIEIAVIAAEGFCAKGLIRHPWLYAIFANTLSYTAGLLLQVLMKGVFQ